MNVADIFAPRTFNDVRAAIARKVRAKFPGCRSWDREDAVSVGVLAVLDYWTERYAGKCDDPAKAFNYAVSFGAGRAAEALIARIEAERPTTSLDRPVTRNEDGDELTYADLLADRGMAPEDAVCSAGEPQREMWESEDEATSGAVRHMSVRADSLVPNSGCPRYGGTRTFEGRCRGMSTTIKDTTHPANRRQHGSAVAPAHEDRGATSPVGGKPGAPKDSNKAKAKSPR